MKSLLKSWKLWRCSNVRLFFKHVW
jgi:hypothetical protein